jgi:hypothetical protein
MTANGWYEQRAKMGLRESQQILKASHNPELLEWEREAFQSAAFACSQYATHMFGKAFRVRVV